MKKRKQIRLTRTFTVNDCKDYHAKRISHNELMFLLAIQKHKSFRACISLLDKCDPAYIKVLFKRYPKTKRKFYYLACEWERKQNESKKTA